MTAPRPARPGPAAPTRAEALAEALAARIVAAQLPPGLRLDEQALATEFGISRTPVREALRLLATTGLVELRPRRGAVVAAPAAEQLRATFEVLAELEALCARWAALRMTPAERRALDRLHRDMAALVRAGDRPGYGQANRALHGLVYAGAHNDHLAEVALGTHRRLAPFRRAQFAAPQRLSLSHAEHGLVVDALLRGAAAGAEETMRRHILSSGHSWASLAEDVAAPRLRSPAA
ncbi:GntR family transcriptional regulator [Roseomonas sp. KE0001]|uniref:GntR family transcriptional regulator n=1 Tax=Roseomonas sp. KE0001 TaxID=2479201 RepID=UPI0018DF6AAC|nr:GntR family transcriptional regulator [Roseomonas sp. KE0001]MBI0435896.1 GntR family transcriptional regulator [Roseomonas sp. KE0001]